MEWLLFTVLIGGVGFAFLARRRRAAVWRGIAREFGLEFSEPGLFAGPRISGRQDEMFVDVRPINQNKTAFVQVMVTYRPAPTEFSITRATRLGTSIRRTDPEALFESVTGTDIEIGQEEFDELATIHGNVPELKTYLTPQRVQTARYLLETFPGSRITGAELRVRTKAGWQEGPRLSHMLGEAIAAAKIIRPQRPRPAGPPDEPEPDAGSSRPSIRPRATVPSLARLTDAQAMADDLFGRGAVSHENERRFRDLYAGRLVRWSGYLIEAHPERSVVKIAELADPLFGASPILVVTDSPTPAHLTVGDWVTADGIASRLDHLERTLYLRDAVTFDSKV